VSWQLIFTKQAQKDAKKLLAIGLKPRAQELLAVLAAIPIRILRLMKNSSGISVVLTLAESISNTA
jgi:hypothetical protein